MNETETAEIETAETETAEIDLYADDLDNSMIQVSDDALKDNFTLNFINVSSENVFFLKLDDQPHFYVLFKDKNIAHKGWKIIPSSLKDDFKLKFTDKNLSKAEVLNQATQHQNYLPKQPSTKIPNLMNACLEYSDDKSLCKLLYDKLDTHNKNNDEYPAWLQSSNFLERALILLQNT